ANMGAPAQGATAQGSQPKEAPAPTTINPFQAMGKAWLDMGSQLTGTTPAKMNTAFDRTYGALGDALGLTPARKLQTAWQDAIAASVTQQEARGSYALVVQSAFAHGIERLMQRLAEKADAGERIESVLELLKLWAINTEEVVHETLQS